MIETVSIVIPSYNYRNYIAVAVDSALAQTFQCQVIVVDDGSTDDSVDILKAYGDRITLIVKPNGGETSAISLGFQHAHGSIIIVLDSDDVLAPDCAETVIPLFAPGIAKVQYQLDTINAAGQSNGMVFPHYHDGLTSAEIFELNRTNGDYPAPPNTGNAFSRSLIEKVLPIDDVRFQHHFDGYINRLAPLYGRVVTLPKTLGFYRVHNKNYWARQDKATMWRLYYEHNVERQEVFERVARSLGVDVPANALKRNLRHTENQILAYRFSPTAEERAQPAYWLKLCWQAVTAPVVAPRVTVIARLLWLMYLCGLLVCPLALLRVVLNRARGAAARSNWVRNVVAISRHGLLPTGGRETGPVRFLQERLRW